MTISKIVRFLGSGLVAVLLIAILAIVLTVATFYESRTTSAAVAAAVYHSWWFAALLFLIGVNVTVAALRRMPWQPRHTGFVITHLAIDVLLVGALMTVLAGVDGSVSLKEGASTDKLSLDNRVVQVDSLPAVPARAGASGTLPDGTLVRVERVLGAGHRDTDVKSDGPSDNPAIHFKVGQPRKGEPMLEAWLVARSDKLAQQSFGHLKTSLAEVKALPKVDASSAPTVEVEVGGKKVSIAVEQLEKLSSESQPVPGTDLQIRLVRRFERAAVDGKDLVENPKGQPNPAIRVELTGPKGKEMHNSFARFPDFPSFHGKSGDGSAPSKARVRYLDGTPDRSPALAFYWLPDKKLVLRLSGKDLPVTTGAPIDTPWMGVQVVVDQVVDRARVVDTYAEGKEGPPVALVSLGKEQVWCAFEEPTKVGKYALRFGPEQVPLGMTVKLKQFTLKTDPGTSRPAAFISDVEVTEGQKTSEHRIQMNEPLYAGGFTFFQSGYSMGDGKGAATSVLRVTKDPGVAPKYAGTLLLVLGILWLFYLEPALERKRKPSPAPSVAQRGTRTAGATTTAVLAFVLLLLAMSAAQAQPSPAAPTAAASPAASATSAPSDDPHAGVPGMPGAHGSGKMPSVHGGGQMPGKPSVHGGHGSFSPPTQDKPSTEPTTLPPPTKMDLSVVRQLPVQANGRVRPLDTLAREIVLTVTGRETFDGRHPVDLLLSWTTYGPLWAQQSVVYVPNRELKSQVGLDAERTRFSLKELASNDKLHDLAQSGRRREQEASAVEREAQTVLERMGILEATFSGRTIAAVPPGTSTEATWLSVADLSAMDKKSSELLVAFFQAYTGGDSAAFAKATRNLEDAMRALGGEAYPSQDTIALEMLYNKLRPFRTSWELYVAALVFFGLGAMWPYLRYLALTLGFGGFVVQTAGLVLRTMVSGRPPVTNMYESVVWVAWGAVALGFVLAWRYRSSSVVVAAGIVASATLMLADMMPGALDPSIQPLMPVLRSNFWLATHVLTITLSYAAFALAMGIGHAWLWMDFRGHTGEKTELMSSFMYATLRVGVLLLAAGTFLGGVWANYSWGRFWGWDPKEVWALIALLGYLGVLHAKYTGWIGDRGVAVGSVLGFLGVLMAWYGVNYVLGKGLHSYGFGNGSGVVYALIFTAVEVLFVVLMLWRQPVPEAAPPTAAKA